MGSILAAPITIGLAFLATKLEDAVIWFKWMIAYSYIEICRRCEKKRFDLYDMDAVNDPVKVGLIPPEVEIALESPKDESHLSKPADEVIFYGVNSSSECFMTKVSRICSDETEVVISLKLRNGKVYEMEKTCCQQQTSQYSDRIFSGGGLKMHYTEPMRKWRIFFKGLLREYSIGDRTSSRMVYVKFGLQWKASSDCFDTLSDINSSDLARSLARMKWPGFLPHLTEFHDAVNSYCQGGVIRGEVFIDGSPENMEVYLFGEKIRNLGSASMIEGYRFSHLLGHTTKNGRIIHISELHIPSVIESLAFGFSITPEGNIEAASNISISKGSLCDNSQPINMTFCSENLDFALKACEVEDMCKAEFGKRNESYFTTKSMAVEVNSHTVKGILMQGHTFKLPKKPILKSAAKSELKDIPLAVSFSDAICQIPEVTGGKGSSLGKLTQLSKKYQNFIVPKGIVVTTSAYENFITDDILKEVKNLENILYGNTPGNVEEACKRTSSTVIAGDIPGDVRQSIIENLQKKYGDALNQKMFAVRSSATGEDSEDMSAAGQMETFLGVSSLEQILLSVKKCWASQFGYVAVQYKRQNGQVINCPMAVVIQEMVTCDVAGVLFTCDPLTGNPTLMSITTNYGLGESVVSGSEEPDTIVLERDADDNLKVKEKIVGAKSRRIVIRDGAPVAEDVSETDREVCSLSDELALRLGNIAVIIEKSYGTERDIEWGYWNNDFYIFQSRPVTSNNEETDYEIDHETDAPLRVENEYFTVCNVGEVMPGATSPLSQEIVLRFFNAVFQRRLLSSFRPRHSKYSPKGLISMYNHTMMIAADLLEQSKEGEAFVKSQMIALFGRIIEEKDLLELAQERYADRKKMPLLPKLGFILMNLLSSSRRLKQAQKQYETYRIPFEGCKTSSDLFNELLKSCTYALDAFIPHIACSNKSTMSNLFLLSSLEKEKGSLDTDVYNDLSELLSSINEVESADVPSAMESLAYHIAKDISAVDFQKMSVEDAEKWLMSSTSDSGERFRDFLKKHGHRCLKEFDVRTATWGENPKQLVKLLQNITGSVCSDRSKKKTKSFHEIVTKLKTPLSIRTRMLFKFILLPMSRSGVQGREASKSLLIKAVNEWRKGYKKLAKLMVSEGRIPDEDLIFFMTILEIQELFRNRSPKIIARAIHRRRRHAILDSYIFPEISSGIPKPVNTDDSEIIPIDVNESLKGIPVSRGVAKGYARVALTLEEASHLKPGEILLTYSTDIGWTPYFPTLAGVGTELGGLISHGAVVSREYGIPCIAGLQGATRRFRTGDYVVLDANKGVLCKVPCPA